MIIYLKHLCIFLSCASDCFHAHSIDEIVDWVQHNLVRYVEPSKVDQLPVPRFGHSFNLQFLKEVTRSVIAVSWVWLFWYDFQIGRRSIRDRTLCGSILRALVTGRALLATIRHRPTQAARCPCLPMALPQGYLLHSRFLPDFSYEKPDRHHLSCRCRAFWKSGGILEPGFPKGSCRIPEW